MKIGNTRSPGIGIGPGTAAAAATVETEMITASTGTGGAARGTGELQSAVLQPALAALREMPEIDHAKVAELRDALAKGELPFDAGKLAGLIERFHGGRS